jgi:lysophospholipase L1-like esterase
MRDAKRTTALVLTLLAALLTSPPASSQARWVGSWGAVPLPPSAAAGPFPATPTFSGQTVRQTVRLSAGGDQIRLRLSNEYGARPLRVAAARVAIVDAAGAVREGSARTVEFNGAAAVTIPAGAPLLSDAIDLPVRDLESLSVSLFFPDDTGPCTCHATAMQDAQVSRAGDFTAAAFEPAETLQMRAFLTGVEVASERARAVVVLGDSISDGIGSTPNANRRWPDLLAERLSARKSRERWGIVNAGISGNRVLSDGAGENALARFDRDVLAVPGATHVIVFEGVNDLGLAFAKFEGPLAALNSLMPPGAEVTRESMIGGYRQLIARAHAKGLKIYGATIAPYEGAAYYSAQGEAVRQAVNEWIRDSAEFDAVLDFDAVLRDRARPSRIAEGLHSGDYLHGSDAGYRAIADSIDLTLFQ